MIRVYHQMHSVTDPHYEFVAEVNTDVLDEAYALTNHIDNDWAMNADVNAMPGNHRSTSVGDLLLVVPLGGTHGECYHVEPFGFKQARMIERGRIATLLRAVVAWLRKFNGRRMS